MRVIFFLLSSFSVLLVGSGCAQRLDEFEVRMKDVDERMRLIESKSGVPVGTDRELLEGRRLADVRSQLAAIKNEQTVANGKVEALEFEVKTLKDQILQLRQDLDRRLAAGATQAAPAPAPIEGARGGAVDAKYQEALTLHQNGDFVKARKLFEEFVKEQPRSSFADNAVFWVGESYFLEKDYRRALIRYDDLIGKFPNSDKKCDARARQIESLKALGMEDQVKIFTELRNAECRKP